MAWTNGPWAQNSSINYGYPYLIDTTVPTGKTVDEELKFTIWAMDDAVNSGYPYLKNTHIPVEDDTGVNRLYMRGRQPQKLFYGVSVVQACYYGGQLVFQSSAAT